MTRLGRSFKRCNAGFTGTWATSFRSAPLTPAPTPYTGLWRQPRPSEERAGTTTTSRSTSHGIRLRNTGGWSYIERFTQTAKHFVLKFPGTILECVLCPLLCVWRRLRASVTRTSSMSLRDTEPYFRWCKSSRCDRMQCRLTFFPAVAALRPYTGLLVRCGMMFTDSPSGAATRHFRFPALTMMRPFRPVRPAYFTSENPTCTTVPRCRLRAGALLSIATTTSSNPRRTGQSA